MTRAQAVVAAASSLRRLLGELDGEIRTQPRNVQEMWGRATVGAAHAGSVMLLRTRGRTPTAFVESPSDA